MQVFDNVNLVFPPLCVLDQQYLGVGWRDGTVGPGWGAGHFGQMPEAEYKGVDGSELNIQTKPVY